MDKYQFIKYTAERFGIDDATIETMIDIFASSLHELIVAGQSVTIDEIGEFKTRPLFDSSSKQQYQQNPKLAQIFKQNTVSFKPSEYLTKTIA